jgi:hypothetical protein
MDRIDGTAARQLDLIEYSEPVVPRRPLDRPQARMRVLRQDIYAELTRRRRRAQIAARRALAENGSLALTSKP